MERTSWGIVDCVGPARETGEVTIIRETCWARLVEVTVTERENLIGVTETFRARHVETREIIKEKTEIKTETREIEGELK